MPSKLSDLVDSLSEMFILMSIVYPYEYTDSWDRFDKTSFPDKKYFCSELNLEDISNKDYFHVQKVFEEFCTDIDDYHDLHVQTDTLLLADVFEKFRDIFIEMYGLDPSHFLSASRIAWQACLKKQM